MDTGISFNVLPIYIYIYTYANQIAELIILAMFCNTKFHIFLKKSQQLEDQSFLPRPDLGHVCIVLSQNW